MLSTRRVPRDTWVPHTRSYTGHASSARAMTFWRRVEENRKSPWRIAGAIGVGTIVLYALGALRLNQALARLSDAMGAKCAVSILPIAEAAIDVDKPDDLQLVEMIISGRAT